MSCAGRAGRGQEDTLWSRPWKAGNDLRAVV